MTRPFVWAKILAKTGEAIGDQAICLDSDLGRLPRPYSIFYSHPGFNVKYGQVNENQRADGRNNEAGENIHSGDDGQFGAGV